VIWRHILKTDVLELLIGELPWKEEKLVKLRQILRMKVDPL
jgi:hypothetical protein